MFYDYNDGLRLTDTDFLSNGGGGLIFLFFTWIHYFLDEDFNCE